jgi:quinoprotein dehydrogenase-associated probable ABC transporter substrate-binding protein
MIRDSIGRRGVAALMGSCLVMFAFQAPAAQDDGILKVCADPSNLPLSNDKGEGYENKIAEALAKDLKLKVEYTYFPQRMGFIRNTLRLKDEQSQQYKCDLIIGVPKDYELTATTQPYMHSTYSLIFASRPDLNALHTADDLLSLPPDRQKGLRIGVFTKSPGADWVLKHGFMEHAAVYTHQNGDIDESPARTIERDLASGKIDAAILWGPIAGMLVQQHGGTPKWRAVPFAPDPAIKFDYEISMGMRQGEKPWKDTLDTWISGHRTQIDAILLSYQVPLVDQTGHVNSPATDGNL